MDRTLTRVSSRFIAMLALLALMSCGGGDTAPESGVSGKWTGQLLQPKTGGNTQFDYSMNLTQSGTGVSGTAHISVLDLPQYYADFNVTGTVGGSVLEFTEVSITKQVPPNTGGSWCLKRGTLTLGGGGKTLTGSWTSANGCAPGTISLTRT